MYFSFKKICNKIKLEIKTFLKLKNNKVLCNQYFCQILMIGKIVRNKSFFHSKTL